MRREEEKKDFLSTQERDEQWTDSCRGNSRPSDFQKGLVSAVMPVYNGELHVAKMLDSLLAQTYDPVEVILVDDGSTDETLSVAESYSSKFARRGYSYRIVRAEHKNASAAISRGLPYVTGEYLIWPDSDDVLAPQSIARRVAFLQENPQYSCVRSLSWYFQEETGEPEEQADEQRGDLSKENLFWDILESRTFVCCGCYMVKTKPFFDIYPERRIPEYDVGQNFQMLLPFMFSHKCPTIREELYGVSIRAGSHSRRTLTQAQEQKKYRDYEHLIDDIASICQIDDKPSKERIARWKARRRYQLALKYRHGGAAISALRQLHRCGGIPLGDALKEIAWSFLVKGRVADKVYPLYRKLFGRG